MARAVVFRAVGGNPHRESLRASWYTVAVAVAENGAAKPCDPQGNQGIMGELKGMYKCCLYVVTHTRGLLSSARAHVSGAANCGSCVSGQGALNVWT